MKWEETNVTFPAPKGDSLTKLIAQYAEKITIPAKTVFLSPGDQVDGVYFIAKGRTRLYMIAEDGSEKVLYALSAGWFFAETPIELNEATSLYVRTETDCIYYRLPHDKYELLMDKSNEFRHAILQSYSKKMRILREEIESLSFSTCKDRLRRLYYSTADPAHLVDGAWYDLKLNYTQYDISTIVGGARVTVSKLINELCA